MDDAPFELMYRRPKSQNHENLTAVLDDILIRLEKLEELVNDITDRVEEL